MLSSVDYSQLTLRLSFPWLTFLRSWYGPFSTTLPPKSDHSVLIRSAATTAQWTQFHGNAARTGRASYPGPGVAKLAWKTGVGCHHWGPGCWLPMFTGTDSSPAISQDGSMAYIGSYDHHLYAVEVMSGKVCGEPN